METETNMFYGRTFDQIKMERWLTFNNQPNWCASDVPRGTTGVR